MNSEPARQQLGKSAAAWREGRDLLWNLRLFPIPYSLFPDP